MKKQMLIVVLGMMLVLCSCGAQSVSSSQAQATAAPAVSEPAGAVSQAAQPTAAPAADATAAPEQEAVEVPAGGTESTPAQSPEKTQPAEQEVPFQEQFKKDAVRELEGLLDEMTPGEDENEAVRQATSLMNWGVGTTLSEDEIASTTKDWLAAQSADQQKQVQAQLKRVEAAYRKLLGSEGEALLNRAGCRDIAAYPWGDGEPLETVEALLNGVLGSAR